MALNKMPRWPLHPHQNQTEQGQEHLTVEDCRSAHSGNLRSLPQLAKRRPSTVTSSVETEIFHCHTPCRVTPSSQPRNVIVPSRSRSGAGPGFQLDALTRNRAQLRQLPPHATRSRLPHTSAPTNCRTALLRKKAAAPPVPGGPRRPPQSMIGAAAPLPPARLFVVRRAGISSDPAGGGRGTGQGPGGEDCRGAACQVWQTGAAFRAQHTRARAHTHTHTHTHMAWRGATFRAQPAGPASGVAGERHFGHLSLPSDLRRRSGAGTAGARGPRRSRARTARHRPFHRPVSVRGPKSRHPLGPRLSMPRGAGVSSDRVCQDRAGAERAAPPPRPVTQPDVPLFPSQ